MKNIFSQWPLLRGKIAKQKKLLLLDFDGTLVPIQKIPSKVHLSSEAKRCLINLSKRKDVRIAIVSGRSARDLYSRVRVKGIVYVGNHGFEWYGMRNLLPKAL